MSNVTVTIPTNGLDMAPTLGPLYWGFLCSLVLTGINLLQGYIYFPSHDRPVIQVTAMSMLVLNIASAALVAQSVYYYLVPHFGSLLPLNAITNELSAECLISTLITFISQGYFVVQLYTVTKVRNQAVLVPAIVAILAFGAFVFGVACTTVMVLHKHSVLSARSSAFSIFFGLAKGFGAITDLVATIAMCVMLASSKSGIVSTNSIVRRIMQYIMQRGVLVTLIQTLLLITFHAAPQHLYWLAFHVNVTKLYANTFFSMLNGREHLNQQRTAFISAYHSNYESRDNHAKAPMSRHGSRSMYDEEYNLSVRGNEDTKGYSVGSPPATGMPLVTKTVLISEL